MSDDAVLYVSHDPLENMKAERDHALWELREMRNLVDPKLEELKRFRRALDDIANHYDDQSFPPHTKEEEDPSCGQIIVNFASAVFWDGYDGYMSDWYREKWSKRDE